MELPMGYREITKYLPHRYPLLLVDRITELEANKRAVGYKNVTANEPFFQGHFPGNPIMPGVLILEAMGQVGGVLGAWSLGEETHRKEMLFIGMEKVRFRKLVVPGDQLILEVDVLRGNPKQRAWKLAGKALVDGDLAAEAELSALLGGK